MDSIQGFWKFGDGSHNRSATPWFGLRSAILTLLLLRDELRAMDGNYWRATTPLASAWDITILV
jgi:hypothetical protein